MEQANWRKVSRVSTKVREKVEQMRVGEMGGRTRRGTSLAIARETLAVPRVFQTFRVKREANGWVWRGLEMVSKPCWACRPSRPKPLWTPAIASMSRVVVRPPPNLA
jgi:hypothetical protein